MKINDPRIIARFEPLFKTEDGRHEGVVISFDHDGEYVVHSYDRPDEDDEMNRYWGRYLPSLYAAWEAFHDKSLRLMGRPDDRLSVVLRDTHVTDVKAQDTGGHVTVTLVHLRDTAQVVGVSDDCIAVYKSEEAFLSGDMPVAQEEIWRSDDDDQ